MICDNCKVEIPIDAAIKSTQDLMDAKSRAMEVNQAELDKEENKTITRSAFDLLSIEDQRTAALEKQIIDG